MTEDQIHVATVAFEIVVFSLLGLLIFREIVCWYWKINEGLKVLREISAKLDRLPTEPTAEIRPPAPPPG